MPAAFYTVHLYNGSMGVCFQSVQEIPVVVSLPVRAVFRTALCRPFALLVAYSTAKVKVSDVKDAFVNVVSLSTLQRCAASLMSFHHQKLRYCSVGRMCTKSCGSVPDYRGIFPCFFRESPVFLFFRAENAWITRTRVSLGRMMSSTYPREAAT